MSQHNLDLMFESSNNDVNLSLLWSTYCVYSVSCDCELLSNAQMIDVQSKDWEIKIGQSLSRPPVFPNLVECEKNASSCEEDTSLVLHTTVFN